MSVTVTGKLNKPASIFQAGESTGFGIRIGVRYYDRETQQNEWTNYECAVFSKNSQQIEFYRNALIEGSVVEITGKSQKIKQFQGNNGLSLSIEIIDASIGFIHTAQQAPQQQGGFQQQPQQQAPQQQQGGFNQQTPQGDFGQQTQAPPAGGVDELDDIPF